LFAALFDWKEGHVAVFIKLDQEYAAEFWPIYEKYEQERAAIGSGRINLIENIHRYVRKYG